MPAEKYSASMDEALLDEVREQAEAEGVTVSAWIAQVARDRLALLGLSRLVTDWEAEHGPIDDHELDRVMRELDGELTTDEEQRPPSPGRRREGGTSPRRRPPSSGEHLDRRSA